MIAKVQGDTVTKDYLDLRLNEAVALLRQEMTKSHADLMKEISALKMDSQFTKWTNKAILLSLGVMTSALIKIAFFHSINQYHRVSDNPHHVNGGGFVLSPL
jgi:hypothetical protein